MGQIKLVHWIMNILPLIHKTEILSTNVSPPLLSNFFSFLFSSTLSINFLSSSCSSTCCAPLLGCSHLIVCVRWVCCELWKSGGQYCFSDLERHGEVSEHSVSVSFHFPLFCFLPCCDRWVASAWAKFIWHDKILMSCLCRWFQFHLFFLNCMGWGSHH